MANTVIAALETLMSLQRWNVMPRVENWTEAENIAYTTHVVYALGKQLEWGDKKIEHAIARSLLKSFNKHFLADIPVKSRRILRQLSDKEGKKAYEKLIDEYARKTARLFPRELSGRLEQYMTIDGKYEDGIGQADKRDVEALIKFSQYKVALDECETNERVYPKRGYESIHEDIQHQLKESDPEGKLDKVYEGIRSYLSVVKNLKYLRRWNRINRTVETSVLSHTFVVTILALMFAALSLPNLRRTDKDAAVIDAILRAMFHDFPETLTGDIITPAKDILNKSCEGLWDKAEGDLINVFMTEVPEALRPDIQNRHLLHELSDAENYSISSLVKDCDRLALVIECHMEFRNGNINAEMTNAFRDYLNILQGSEWRDVREFTQRIAVDTR